MAVKGTVNVVLGMAVAVACIVLARDAMLSAQQRSAPEPARPDVNAALLAEVRALRADLAQSNQASLRAQLLVARVQLQEQRIMYFDRRRADLASRTAEAAEKAREASSELQTVEARLKQIRSETPQIPKEQLVGLVEMFEDQIKKLTEDAQAAFDSEQRLRSEEADVQSVLASEQGRWSDFNARLDELERAIPK
jgi:chromosome segregation ATPase